VYTLIRNGCDGESAFRHADPSRLVGSRNKETHILKSCKNVAPLYHTQKPKCLNIPAANGARSSNKTHGPILECLLLIFFDFEAPMNKEVLGSPFYQAYPL